MSMHLLLSTVNNIKPLNNLLFPHKEVREHAVYLVLFNCPLPSWIIHNLLSASIQKGRWKRQYRWQKVKEKSLYKSSLSQFTWENVKSMLMVVSSYKISQNRQCKSVHCPYMRKQPRLDYGSRLQNLENEDKDAIWVTCLSCHTIAVWLVSLYEETTPIWVLATFHLLQVTFSSRLGRTYSLVPRLGGSKETFLSSPPAWVRG